MCIFGVKVKMGNWDMEVGGEYYVLLFVLNRKVRKIFLK